MDRKTIMKMPKVSVIVPNYNHASYLKERLDSIFNQTFQDFEVILLDDASTDNSVEILNDYSKDEKVSHIIINKNNSGSPFKQWRKGIEKAKGVYIWIAESDDFAEHTFLETTVNELNQNNNISLVYTDSQTVDNHNKKSHLWSNSKNYYFKTKRWSLDYINNGKEEIMDFLLYRTTINNASAVLFRRDNLFDVIQSKALMEYKNVGDLFIYILSCDQGEIKYCALPLNNYREHHFNTTKQNKKTGLLYIERFNCFINILPIFINDINNLKISNKLERAYDFIFNKNIFQLLNNNELVLIKMFLKKMYEFKIYSWVKTNKILLLITIYSINNKHSRKLSIKALKYQIKNNKNFKKEYIT